MLLNAKMFSSMVSTPAAHFPAFIVLVPSRTAEWADGVAIKSNCEHSFRVGRAN